MGPMALDEVDTVVGHQVRGVALLHADFVVAPPILVSRTVDLSVVITVSRDQAAEFVESLVGRHQGRLVAQVPLAVHAGHVPGRFEYLGECNRLKWQAEFCANDQGSVRFQIADQTDAGNSRSAERLAWENTSAHCCESPYTEFLRRPGDRCSVSRFADCRSSQDRRSPDRRPGSRRYSGLARRASCCCRAKPSGRRKRASLS